MVSYSLFNDEKFKTMFEKLSPEEHENYKKKGEYMYTKDYAGAGSEADRFMENAAYIKEGLKSGLLPSQLSTSEKEIMVAIYGRLWYEKFGYSSDNNIGTSFYTF